VTHPLYGVGDNPGDDDYFWADEATDILIRLFEDESCCEDDATDAPRAVLDMKRGTIELLKKRYRNRRRVAESRTPEAAVAPIRLRLTSKADARN
jgi:hypothetical protein